MEMNEIKALEMQRSLNPYSDADRELLRSGEISSEEFKKRKAAHIAENKALREEIRDTYKSQKAMERGDSDFTYSPSAK